jgi:hypothetical protein
VASGWKPRASAWSEPAETGSDFAAFSKRSVWASAPRSEQPTAFGVAVAVLAIQDALFHAWSALFIGLPFVLLGISGLLDGGGFPRWLGVVALIGGAGALFMGVAGFLNVPVHGALFNVFALLVTLWVLVAGALVLRGPARSSVTQLRAASAV